MAQGERPGVDSTRGPSSAGAMNAYRTEIRIFQIGSRLLMPVANALFGRCFPATAAVRMAVRPVFPAAEAAPDRRGEFMTEVIVDPEISPPSEASPIPIHLLTPDEAAEFIQT